MADNENPLSEINWQTIISSFDDPLTLLQWLKKIVEEQGAQTITSLDIEAVDAGVVKFVITMENGDTIESENFTYVTPSALSTALAGKLDKVDTVTGYAHAYIKKPDGTQGTMSLTDEPTNTTIVARNASGRASVSAPASDNNIANKKYVDDADATKVDKVTGTTAFEQAYVKFADGTQSTRSISQGADGGTIARRNTNATITVATPTNNSDCATKEYVDDRVSGTNDGTNWLTITIGGNTYAVTGGGGGSATWGGIIGTLSNQTDLQNALDGKLDKVGTYDTYTRVYAIGTNGAQFIVNMTPTNIASAIMRRDSNGCCKVSSPSADDDCATKKYVDDAVSGAVSPHLYRHNIRLYLASTYDITFTYISNSDTAIDGTSIADLFPSGASRSASGGFNHSSRPYSVVRLTRCSATEFTVYGVGIDSNNAYDEQDDDFTYAGATVTDVVETIL